MTLATDTKRILIVDDDAGILSMLSLLLKQQGYGVVTAFDGQEALLALEADLPDIILLDLNMPVMDGYQFAREFKASYDETIPIVVVSAVEKGEGGGDEIGAVAWIKKPFDLKALLSVVEEHV